MKTIFDTTENIYLVSVKYKDDYFENKSEPLFKTLEFASSRPRTLDYIQKAYPNCKVLSIEKIK